MVKEIWGCFWRPIAGDRPPMPPPMIAMCIGSDEEAIVGAKRFRDER